MDNNNNHLPQRRRHDNSFGELMERMDAFFNESIRNFDSLWSQKRFKVVIDETDTEMIVEAALPGYSRDQIELEILGRQLRIAALDTSSFEEKNDKNNFYKKEHSYRKAERIVTLPFPISKKDTKASFQNGLLKITIPKRNDSRTFIDIESND
mgnify:FL=1